MERYVCIHGHFYQPPRENPWLEAIEMQDSAFPHHDWNQRITDECYEPNSTSRILNGEKCIIDIVNNYSKISFNFGPTLLAWLENNSPDVYKSILRADEESKKRYSGHGSALAQVYNHVILPLANAKDRYTQIIWGIKDFEYRFSRYPEGMWLSETAVDLETLDILAELKIKFTILSPYQASHIRKIGDEDWEDVSGGRIDPTRPYQIILPSNRKISVFFYDGPISQSVAFEGLLNSGDIFASRLISGFSDQRQCPQIVNIATDGESYGHHHHYGDMALAYALHYLEANNLAKLTNYGEYLAKFQPTHEVRIIEKSSWSCSHGVERWRKNCGCNSGGHPEWNQEWRTPLRKAFDWLRDKIIPGFEETSVELFKDPWASRNDYISVILDRSETNLNNFFNRNSLNKLNKEEKIRALKHLELQRHAMLMYTSCGWFFDELSGIETVQVIQYAGRVVQLSKELFGSNIEEEFLSRLELAKSNLNDIKNGRVVYEKYVKTTMIDLIKVAAHYAVSSLFEEYYDAPKIYCYDINILDYHKAECGKARLGVGKIEVVSQITKEMQLISFGVLHFGDHNLNAGVRAYRGVVAYREMVSEITETFSRGELSGVIRLMEKHFGVSNYSLTSLFKDEQNKIVNIILKSTLSDIEAEFRKIYQSNYPLMMFLINIGNFIPRAFQSSARLILNNDLRKALAEDNPDIAIINKLLSDVALWKVGLGSDLGHVFRKTLEKKSFEFGEKPDNLILLNQILALVELSGTMPFSVELRVVQNIYFKIYKTIYTGIKNNQKEKFKFTGEWEKRFILLGEKLSICTNTG